MPSPLFLGTLKFENHCTLLCIFLKINPGSSLWSQSLNSESDFESGGLSLGPNPRTFQMGELGQDTLPFCAIVKAG